MAQQDPDSWMWDKARELLERADRLHRRFFQLGRSRYNRPTWEPPVDIFETDEEFLIVVALPGIEPERIEILMESGVLTITGERTMPVPCRRATVHRLEIPHGRFERNIELPQGRFDLVRRDQACGCLLLHLKKIP